MSGPDKLLCLCVVGTRPEVIKLAPVIRRLRETDWADTTVVSSGQHDVLLSQAFADFGLTPDLRLDVERRRPSVLELLSQVIDRLDRTVLQLRPDCIIAQGDTTTAAAASIVAFHHRLPFVHVEAGLRTSDLSAPFPEEYNRRVAALAATLHCAPTEQAVQHLVAEGVAPDSIVMSGNTVIDALLDAAARKPALPDSFPAAGRTILVTAHRRESFGAPLDRALSALRKCLDRFPDLNILFPVHPNPEARASAERCLGGHPRAVLVEPLGYNDMVSAMQHAWLVVTDSGGLQEEAPALGKPVLVLRDSTERPEAVATGVVRLVGTDPDAIATAIVSLRSPDTYARMARRVFPYGDGAAAERIVAAMKRLLVKRQPADELAWAPAAA